MLQPASCPAGPETRFNNKRRRTDLPPHKGVTIESNCSYEKLSGIQSLINKLTNCFGFRRSRAGQGIFHKHQTTQQRLLVIQLDLSADGLCPGLGDWIVETTKAIDVMVPPLEPQPDLESTVVISQPRWLLQHPSPLREIRA